MSALCVWFCIRATSRLYDRIRSTSMSIHEIGCWNGFNGKPTKKNMFTEMKNETTEEGSEHRGNMATPYSLPSSQRHSSPSRPWGRMIIKEGKRV